MTRAAGILLCAGGSARMGFDKLAFPIAGKTAVERSAEALALGGVETLVLTASGQNLAALSALSLSVPHKVVPGGGTRAESVRLALAVVEDADVVAIHDAARCLVSPALVRASIESARLHGSGIVASRAADTTFLLEADACTPLPREKLLRTQTPQTFDFARIRRVYEGDLSGATDECSLYLAAGYVPRFVFAAQAEANQKLTTPEDWLSALAQFARFGTGFDTHRLVSDRALVLGGVQIPFEKGLLGHSDADVLTHALIDALLGAAALGDIGKLFPDTDPAYAGADSMDLLREVMRRLQKAGLAVGHADMTVLAERPKLAPYIPRMRAALSEALGVPLACVSVKATTTEGMNDEGRGLCISAYAVVSLR